MTDQCPLCKGKGTTTKSRLALYINYIVMRAIEEFLKRENARRPNKKF